MLVLGNRELVVHPALFVAGRPEGRVEALQLTQHRGSEVLELAACLEQDPPTILGTALLLPLLEAHHPDPDGIAAPRERPAILTRLGEPDAPSGLSTLQ